MKMILSLFFILFSSGVSHAELKLALNWKPEPQFGGFYAADLNGHFKKEGLSLQILPGGSGTPTIQMLASGVVDYAVVSADEIILSHARGATDVIAVFAAYQTNPQGIMTHAEKNFKSLGDVFTSQGTLLWQQGLPYAQFLLKKYPSRKVVMAPYSGGIGLFLKDPQLSQQVFVTSEPLAAEKAGAKVKTFLVSESGYNPYTTVLAVKSSRLKSSPQEIQKVVQAVRKGWIDYLANPVPTNKKMQTLNPALDLETFNKSADVQKPLIVTEEVKSKGPGFMTAARWQELVAQMKDLKLIDKTISAEELHKNIP